MRGDAVREKLASGGIVVNVMLPFHAPAIVEMLGVTGVDCVMLDAEHGAIDEAHCEEMIRAGDVVGLPVIARVARNDAPSILRILDTGASGVIVPHVTTPDDARRAVAAAKYGPLGNRSYGSPRAALYGARGDAAEFVERANRETLVIGLFEDVAGVDALDEIVAVEGLDALSVGPNDLAFSMGLPAQPWHPDVQAVVDRVIAACRRAGKATGLPAADLAQARDHARRGCQIISVGVASLVVPTARAVVQGLGGSS